MQHIWLLLLVVVPALARPTDVTGIFLDALASIVNAGGNPVTGTIEATGHIQHGAQFGAPHAAAFPPHAMPPVGAPPMSRPMGKNGMLSSNTRLTHASSTGAGIPDGPVFPMGDKLEGAHEPDTLGKGPSAPVIPQPQAIPAPAQTHLMNPAPTPRPSPPAISTPPPATTTPPPAPSTPPPAPSTPPPAPSTPPPAPSTPSPAFTPTTETTSTAKTASSTTSSAASKLSATGIPTLGSTPAKVSKLQDPGLVEMSEKTSPETYFAMNFSSGTSRRTEWVAVWLVVVGLIGTLV